MKTLGCLLSIGLALPLARVGGEPAMQDTSGRPALSQQRRTASETLRPRPVDVTRALPRLFQEPLVALDEEPSLEETEALRAALQRFATAKVNGEPDWPQLRMFLAEHPRSPWRLSLLLNLGAEYYQNGYFSHALDSWRQAWTVGRTTTDAAGRALADRALAELLRMLCRLGRVEEIKPLLAEIEGRAFRGVTAEMIETSRESLWMMENRPEKSFRCGPHALERIHRYTKPNEPLCPDLIHSVSTPRGLPLMDVATLSKKVGVPSRAARRPAGAGIPIPAVVHWKLNHYGAVLKHEKGRYLLDDPTFGNGLLWLSEDALSSEGSGYFLIPEGPLPEGWEAVDEKEAGNVWGRGYTNGDQPGSVGPGNPCGCRCESHSGNAAPGSVPNASGLATWDVYLMMASVEIADTPAGYTPPLGPPIYFNVQYNQREANQPAMISYANFGPRWNCDWIGSLTFDTANAYFNRGQGGLERFSGLDAATQSYLPDYQQANRLVRINATRYELYYPDGRKLVFGLPDNTVAPSRLFMTAVVDAQGNAATLTYDANFRLAKIIDAIGQESVFTYGTGAQSFLIRKITDPFGRFATFDYSATGQLTNITDVVGLTSGFSYVSPTNDTIQTLTTGYGTTSFVTGGANNMRFAEITHPNGERERFEQRNGATPGIPASDPAAVVPAGLLVFNNFLDGRNTLHWDRKAMAEASGVYARAWIYHFMHQDLNTRSPILESIKPPLENRIWFNYQGQNGGGFFNYGMLGAAPSKVARVLEDGQTQLSQARYNALGRVTQQVDPMGRTLLYSYASNNIDVLEVRRVTGPGQTARLASFTWNDTHLPLQVTDAAGQTTTLSYNSFGQPLTIMDARGERTSFTYNTRNYLVAIDGPLAGTNDTISLSYDALGRVRTVTEVDGYTLTYDYDALDRPTRLTYPDGTFRQMTYRLLDNATSRDRRGRLTTYTYDALRQLVSTIDPLGRTNRFDWCGCGAMAALFDPLGRMTQWTYDVAGRPTAKIYADGSKTTYAYDATGRLKSVTDPKGQTKLYAYGLDDALTSVSYPSALIATPTVRYVYDPYVFRITERIDGGGSTRYRYHPINDPPTLGAGLVQSVDGPLPNDTITYSYDVLGRVVNQAIDGVTRAVAYDGLGRITNAANSLGSFPYAYVGATRRLASLSLPNGQSTTFDYFPNAGDRRLKEIWHKLPGGATLSKFNYTYDADGIITSWTQQRGANPARVLAPAYDLADRLTGATLDNPTRAFGYTYDSADNRLSETIDGAQVTATHNALNELVNLSTNALPDRSYEWDAKDRLVAINYPATGQRTEFTYDGMDRRGRVVEKTNGVVNSDKRFVWCGYEICEERDSSGTVTKRFLSQGTKIASGPQAGNYFYAHDHLGSITELTDAAGAVRARYEYDPWGRRARLSGDLDTDFAFTGHYFHAPSELYLAPFRTYDPALGRWSSRDRLRAAELRQGPNLYAFVGNQPLLLRDPSGLAPDLTYLPGGLNSLNLLHHLVTGAVFDGSTIQIVAHGDPNTYQILGRNGEPLNLEQLAKDIKGTLKWRQGIRKVRLLVCQAGQGSDPVMLQALLGEGAVVEASDEELSGFDLFGIPMRPAPMTPEIQLPLGPTSVAIPPLPVPSLRTAKFNTFP